jgi:hypothetical protein
VFLKLMTRKPTARKCRGIKSKLDSNIAGVIELLERRQLLSAVNDSVTIPANQTSIVVDVLANDTGMSPSIASVGQPTSGGMTSVSDAKVSYTLPVMTKSLADYTAANNTAISAIANWQATEIGQISNFYSAVNSEISRFGTFLGGWVGGMSTVGGMATGVGEALGGYAAVGGKAISLLATAYGSHLNSSNADIIAAAQQLCADQQAAGVLAAQGAALAMTNSLNAQLVQVPNPTVYTSDSFTYVESEMVMVPMMGMPGMMFPMSVQSTATVTVAMNVTDYSAMVNNVNNWVANNSGILAMHTYAGTPDLNQIYGGILLTYASQRGWTVTWQNSTNYWYAAVTDFLFLDATDIASELNRIGYRQ